MTENFRKTKHDLLIDWNITKERLHFLPNHKLQHAKESEIWWVGVGENVGVEINGKSEYFSRPVLVFKKLSHFGFLGIPLTTKQRSGSWYINFKFQDKEVCAVLSQIKMFSTARLYGRLGQVAENDMDKIKDGFRKLYLGE